MGLAAGRACVQGACGEALDDTIVHFGEEGRVDAVHAWPAALAAAEVAGVCRRHADYVGPSLHVLRCACLGARSSTCGGCGVQTSRYAWGAACGS
jgi:hypothetical protein